MSPTPLLQEMETFLSTRVVEVAEGCFDLGCWTVCNGTGWSPRPPPIHLKPALYLTLFLACISILFLLTLHIYTTSFPDKISVRPPGGGQVGEEGGSGF